MEQNVPEAERPKASEVLVRILNGVLLELMQSARGADGLQPLATDEKTQKFMTQAVLSLSDVQLYPEPVVFELTNFEQVQASVFQVARAPGKLVVYLGCLFLILGVFAMCCMCETGASGSGWLRGPMAARTPAWRCPPTAKPWMWTVSLKG